MTVSELSDKPEIKVWNIDTTGTEEQPIDDEEAEPKTEEDEEGKKDEDIEAEDAKEKEDKPKTKKVETTVWDWELANDSKPIWTCKPVDVEDKEYSEFYNSLTKDTQDPLSKVHFVAFVEGKVTFKSLLFFPKVQPSDSFNKYGTQTDNIKYFILEITV
ncbi:endoplasmin homolog [Lycorma delicatula]|uniref:endoplasmin homolog n=1 Tax=Lycorma delicatula TaxID=130591 RepID=UPI003F511312